MIKIKNCNKIKIYVLRDENEENFNYNYFFVFFNFKKHYNLNKKSIKQKASKLLKKRRLNEFAMFYQE